MRLHRRFAVLFLAASLAGGLLAQDRVAIDDETIFIAVEDALRGARLLARANITVRSREGNVTLSGVASTVKDIAEAGRLTSLVRGVTSVHNEIRIADRPVRG